MDRFFCGKDAAIALGYKDTVNALKTHGKEDEGEFTALPIVGHSKQLLTIRY